MDVSLVIRQRLEEFGLDQRELARAAQVTESYISQLLTRRKAPPAPSRTDIYDKMDRFLKLPSGELARLADVQRKEELKRELGEEPAPLFGEVRELILRKCHPDKEAHLRAIFEKQPFGELERLVTQRLLDVVKAVATAGTGERLLAPHGGGARRPKLRGNARHRARVPRYGHLPSVPGALRLVPGSADRVLGHRPGDVCPGHRPEPQSRSRSM